MEAGADFLIVAVTARVALSNALDLLVCSFTWNRRAYLNLASLSAEEVAGPARTGDDVVGASLEARDAAVQGAGLGSSQAHGGEGEEEGGGGDLGEMHFD